MLQKGDVWPDEFHVRQLRQHEDYIVQNSAHAGWIVIFKCFQPEGVDMWEWDHVHLEIRSIINQAGQDVLTKPKFEDFS